MDCWARHIRPFIAMNIQNYLHHKRPHKIVFSSEHVSWYERLSEDAYVGWVVIMSISLVTALALIIYAVWLFFLIDSGKIVSPQSAMPASNHIDFDENSLESVISSFSAKNSATAVLLKSYDGPSDPSN